MKTVFVIEPEEIMAECVARAVGAAEVRTFRDGIAAMAEIAKGVIPDLIFLEIFLDGPDGFTFLNELVSYSDTARIPIIIVSNTEFQEKELREYGVVKCLLKEKMRPEEIRKATREYLGGTENE